MPYIKGVVHEVDFRAMFRELGADHVTDCWGVDHPIQDVDLILTESMFKGLGWMTDAGLSFPEFLARCKAYRHGLYISETSQPFAVPFTELNYQFLNTAAIDNEQFRPGDLPPGWTHDPNDDVRHWITKTTEIEYYRNVADESFRVDRYTKTGYPEGSMGWHRAQLLKRNPLFIREKPFCEAYEKRAESILNSYARGNLYAAGDNRYLSDDLLLLIRYLVHDQVDDVTKVDLARETLKEGEFYAPGFTYYRNEKFTLLRNPHIARNEETVARCPEEIGHYRQKYLSHLTYVVMVNAESLIPERLGGADYDGDMIKTIADPLVNECVSRNYEFDRLDNIDNLPLLYIPAEEPVIRDARDWHDRFVTVRDTFSSRVGQICNAAFRRSIVAYDENSDAKARQKAREETETLAILTGLEIDSAKSGVKPDLSAYLGRQKGGSNSVFLQYKALLDDDGDNAWYEPTAKQKMKHFINATDWNAVTSNVERLPYLAEMLRKNTPKIKGKPAKDSDLFAFAEAEGWKDKLDPVLLSSASDLIRDYEAVLNRIRTCRAPIKQKTKQSDIDRILYARGQEEDWDSDELYAGLSELSPERVSEIRKDLTVHSWHLMDADERLGFLGESLPEFEEYFGLFSDFRAGGYRILGDLICDIDDENRATAPHTMGRKELFRDQDSPAFSRMMWAYVESASSQYYRSAVAAECRELLTGLVKPKNAVRVLVALGKRNLLWELIPDLAAKEVKRYAQ